MQGVEIFSGPRNFVQSIDPLDDNKLYTTPLCCGEISLHTVCTQIYVCIYLYFLFIYTYTFISLKHHRFYRKNYTNEYGESSMYVVKECLFPWTIAFTLQKNSPYTERFYSIV
jgi:hypothetical protein